MNFFFLTASFFVQGQDGITFRDAAWEQALKDAQTESKLIFMECRVDWSQPCEILEKYTFSDKAVGQFFNERFVNVQMDMEGMPGVMLAEEYGVSSFPTLLFLDAEGNVVHRGCGAVATDELIALAEEAQGEDHLSAMNERFISGNYSNDFLIKFSKQLANACMNPEDYLMVYFDSLSNQEMMSEASWNMINLNISDPFSEPFQFLLRNKNAYAEKFGRDTVDTKIYNTLLDIAIDIYEEADLRLFATRALDQMISEVDFEGKSELKSLAGLKIADLKENWPLYAQNAIKGVAEQGVTDPDQLNEFAWKFYLFVEDQEKLRAAAEWMKMTVGNYPNATYFDSYASLLYKLGEEKKAVKYSELALQAAELEVEDLMHYQMQLEKFKGGK